MVVQPQLLEPVGVTVADGLWVVAHRDCKVGECTLAIG